jgi:hypothetical protein
VLSTVNIQHLESLNDVVEQITGIAQQETVPDAVVRRADQIELVDMTPEALRRQLAHGNMYPAERVDAALANYFRIGNLTALRELALLWLADRVDEGLQRYKAEHDIDHVWEARGRVVVALTGGPEGETLIRRASPVAQRSGNSALLAVHVLASDGLTGASPGSLRTQRALVESLGGSYHQVVGDDVAAALLEFARGVAATQLVIGTSRRSRWSTPRSSAERLSAWRGDRGSPHPARRRPGRTERDHGDRAGPAGDDRGAAALLLRVVRGRPARPPLPLPASRPRRHPAGRAGDHPRGRTRPRAPSRYPRRRLTAPGSAAPPREPLTPQRAAPRDRSFWVHPWRGARCPT